MSSSHHQIFTIVTLTLSTSRLTEQQTFKDLFFSTSIDGDPKDISTGKVTITSAGIGTIVGQGTTNETLGTKFIDFDISPHQMWNIWKSEWLHSTQDATV